MQICRYCNQERPENDFEVCRIVGDKVYRRRKCRSCKYDYNSDRRASLRAWIVEYKKTLRCERCGFSDHRALTFHHNDQNEKRFNVAEMSRNLVSPEAIRKEVAKCTVLCANCHEIEHYEQKVARRRLPRASS